MPDAFIVMQIGNPELDQMCADAIVPAVAAAGLDARRVDKHNQGGLLKSEIVRFIQSAPIIVADLTNERPNVYLEIGYAMGLDKFRNLILTVREDHFPSSPSYRQGGPRIHFDLAGYDILAWDAANLPAFRDELEKRIRRRLAIVSTVSAAPPVVYDEEWIGRQRTEAQPGLVASGKRGSMEVRAALHPPKVDRTQTQLSEAAQAAPISTFGWPIAVYLTKDELRPRPRADGIFASIPSSRNAYDYWAIRRNGDFYFLGTLFEDERAENALFFNTRIVRITEAFLYLLRLYLNLGVDRSSALQVTFRFVGLKDRVLSSVGDRRIGLERRSLEDEVEIDVSGTLDEIEADLTGYVKQVAAPLFRVFDFFELSDPVYEDIVSKFVDGKVT